MDFNKLSIETFLAKFAGLPLRAKVLRALSLFRNGLTPVCAVCFSDHARSFTIFNHLPVGERWDLVKQVEIQGDIFETVILTAGSHQYNEIEIGKAFQFSANWHGGAVKFGPVEAEELWKGFELVHAKDAKTHNEQHPGENYEFLIEMFFVTSATMAACLRPKFSPLPQF